MRRYHNTDVWTFLKRLLMIEHMKMMQMLYLDIRSMLLSGQVPYRTNSIQLFWNGLFQKKNREGGSEDILFWKKPWNFFLCSVPMKIPGKTKLHSWKFGTLMYVTSLANFKAKKSRPLEILHEVFLVFLWNSTLFLINHWKFCMLFYEFSWKFYMVTLPLPCLDFFWNSPISKTLCSSNTFLYSGMKIIYHQLLVEYFHKLISMQDVGNMLHLH